MHLLHDHGFAHGKVAELPHLFAGAGYFRVTPGSALIWLVSQLLVD